MHVLRCTGDELDATARGNAVARAVGVSPSVVAVLLSAAALDGHATDAVLDALVLDGHVIGNGIAVVDLHGAAGRRRYLVQPPLLIEVSDEKGLLGDG